MAIRVAGIRMVAREIGHTISHYSILRNDYDGVMLVSGGRPACVPIMWMCMNRWWRQ